MARQRSMQLKLRDGTAVDVDYSVVGSGEYDDPYEFTVTAVLPLDGEGAVDLSDEEMEFLTADVAANHVEEYDESDYHDQ